jgi:hypothetical protein
VVRAADLKRAALALAGGCAFAAAASDAGAADYYVRPDGGDAAQCSGRVDRARTARSNECAWQHPFVALPPGGEPRVAGGDALHIRPGSYRMGLGALQTKRCAEQFPWDCHMPPIPSGPSATQPTRISGLDAQGRCNERPELWGAERAARVLNLQGSRHVAIDCLEITDRSSCVENHCHGGQCGGEVARCERDVYPFGDWAGTGIFASDSASVTLRDVIVHGMALRGIHAGRLRDWRLERVVLRGNGWSGWDGDLGDGDSSNSGTLEFVDVEIAWNGCAERYPTGEPFGCWGQSSGGYGDGFGTAATDGDWRFERVKVHHNASDGLDLLYLNADATLQVTHSQLHANAGNQLKASGAAVIENNTIDGACSALSAHGLPASDHCRAGGNALVLALQPGREAKVVGNTLSGQGDCLAVAEQGDASSALHFEGNRLRGAPMWNATGKLSCGFYAHETDARIELDDNDFVAVRRRDCPPGNRCTD